MNTVLKEQVLANRRHEDKHIQSGKTKDFYVAGASLRSLSIKNLENISYESSIIHPHVVIPYVQEGEMAVDYLDSGSSVNITRSKSRLVFQPEFHIRVSYSGKKSFKGTRLLLDEPYLERYQSLIEQYIPNLARSLDKGKEFISSSAYSNTSIDEWQALSDITNCQFTGELRDMYIESKVGELLALRFSGYTGQGQKTTRKLKAPDYSKIENVRFFLEDSFHRQHSLSSLAREFGLNTFKLKVGFKELYGIPVYQFILKLRMVKAKELLLQGMNVNEVSQTMGYSQANYFSMAFKKHHGFSPGTLK